ncbi:MAG: carbohydrate ABC transporter permease [Solirubrobacteraceae bacterium]
MATNDLVLGDFERRVKSSRRRVRVQSVSRHVVLLLFTGGALVPIYFMVVSALKTNHQFAASEIGLPSHPTLSTLNAAVKGGTVLSWLGNSAIFTSASVVLSTALAALCAYPLSLMRWRPSRWLLTLMIALMVIPPIALVVPLFQIVVDLNQLSTYRSVIVIYTGIMLPFSTFLLVSFFSTIPRSLLEAARIDGASTWRTFLHVVLPLGLPAIITVITVQALWVWNEVLIAVIFLQKESLRTLMVGLTLFNSRYQVDVPIVMAGMLIGTLPMLIVYLIGQRFFIRGLTAGGVKG